MSLDSVTAAAGLTLHSFRQLENAPRTVCVHGKQADVWRLHQPRRLHFEVQADKLSTGKGLERDNDRMKRGIMAYLAAYSDLVVNVVDH